MDDFEEAVETQTLPQFLKQDADTTSLSNTAPTVGEAELERLMREMSDSDLDALAGALGVEGAGKVGLIVPEGSSPTDTDTLENDGTGTGAGVKASREVDDSLEVEGLKGTVERVASPDLELEKKFAGIEIGGASSSDGVASGSKTGTIESGVREVVSAGVSDLKDAISGADKEEPGPPVFGKEKLD